MKLDQVARFDRAVMRGDAKVTDEGYIRANAVVTRTGIFNYKNPDGTIRRELRHPEDVLNEDSIESMKMIPVTNGHPKERLVSADNAKSLAVGYTGETIEQDGDYILSRLVITDADSVKDVIEKNRKELSLGYTVDLIQEDGTYNGQPYDYRQSNIRYNHLSIVDMARAGAEARIALDSSDAVEIFNEESNMAKVKIRIDQEELMVEPKTADHYEKLMSDYKNLMAEKERVEAELAMISRDLEKAKAERDSMQDKVTQLPEGDKPGPTSEEKMDSATFHAKVKERVKLLKLAETVLDGESYSKVESMSDMEIKKKIVMARSSRMNLDGKSEVYIDAAFDIAVQELNSKATPRAEPRGTFNRDTSDMPSADASRKNMIGRMINPKVGGK